MTDIMQMRNERRCKLILKLRTAASPEYPLGKLMHEAADELATFMENEHKLIQFVRERLPDKGTL